MTSLRDDMRSAFREIGAEHEATWAWEHLTSLMLAPDAQRQWMGDAVGRRRSGEPLAYILGEWPFLNLNLRVGPGVLIPRPETEELAEKLSLLASAELKQRPRSEISLLDLGAGSGALGIAVANDLLKKFPDLIVTLHAVERSADAFKILSENLNRFARNE